MTRTRNPQFKKILVSVIGTMILLLIGGLVQSQPGFALETLTLETVLKQVETENSELKILEERLKFSKLQMARSQSDVLDLVKDLINTSENEKKLSIAIQAYITPLRYTQEVEALTREKDFRVMTLKQEAEAAYRNILEDQAGLVLAKYNLNVARKDEAAKKALFDLGRIARIDYDRAVVARSEAELKTKAIERSIELSFMKLNALIEKPASARYDLKMPVATLALPKIQDVAAAVEFYKTKSNTILKQAETIALTAKEVDIYRGFGVSKTIGGVSRIEGLAEKERNLNIETLRLAIMKRSADYDFRIAWNDLQTSYESFTSAHSKYLLSSKELEIAKIRYERGMTTAQDYLKAASANETARLARQTAIKDFQLKHGNFMAQFSVEAFLGQ